MTHEEFQSGIQRLVSVYGDRALPPERLALIWRTAQYLSLRVWDEAVSEVIGEYAHFPPLSKFKDAIYATRKKLNQGETDFWSDIRRQIDELAKSKNSCRNCLGIGTIAAYRIADPYHYLYTFGCSCRAGDLAMTLPEHKNKIRQWNIGMRNEWRPEHESDSTPNVVKPGARVLNLPTRDLNEAIGMGTSTSRDDSEQRWDVEE